MRSRQPRSSSLHSLLIPQAASFRQQQHHMAAVTRARVHTRKEEKSPKSTLNSNAYLFTFNAYMQTNCSHR